MINNSNFDNYFVFTNEESGLVLSKIFEFLLLDSFNQVIKTLDEGLKYLKI